jgi:hypothetical protein
MESLGARVLSRADGGNMRGWGDATRVVELGVRGMRTGTSMDMLDDTVGKKTVPMFGCFGKIDLPKNK